MGMFDSVLFQCPSCGEMVEVQSKAGECCLAQHDSDRVPAVIADSIDSEETYCESCGKRFRVARTRGKTKTVPMRLVLE